MTALHEAQWLAPIRQLQWVLHFKGTYRDADLVHRAGAQKGKAVPISAFAPMTQTMCYNISSYCPSPKHEDHTTGEWLCLELWSNQTFSMTAQNTSKQYGPVTHPLFVCNADSVILVGIWEQSQQKLCSLRQQEYSLERKSVWCA